MVFGDQVLSQSNQVASSDSELTPAMRRRLLALPSVRLRLEFQFAVLTAAGGFLLAAGQGAESILAIALFSSIIGFLFVDWLRLFELPPIGAYLAMAGAAAYCVWDFWQLQQLGRPQMVSVALLLVLVQGVLMLQRKSRRILEQLAVFCLLELVVAAIFNDAISFGLMMIPLSIVAASALSLLGVVSLMESIDVAMDTKSIQPPSTRWGRLIRIVIGQGNSAGSKLPLVVSASPESVVSVYQSAGRWSRYVLFALTPAVVLATLAFFYLLPRKVEPSRSIPLGPALVGFDDELRMEQLGQVMQSSKVALKIRLKDGQTDRPYLLTEPLYLRGKVLETYTVDYGQKRPVGKWVAMDELPRGLTRRLPKQVGIASRSRIAKFDTVRGQITCEPMSRPSLFAIAPYFGTSESEGILHEIGSWTLMRDVSGPPYPRISYQFGTTAFFSGVQSRWIAREQLRARGETVYNFGLFQLPGPASDRLQNQYERRILAYDRSGVPSAAVLALQILESIDPEKRTQVEAAQQFEQFLSTDPRFSYTLDLSAVPIPDVDPVEQFLSVDRRGHCQYFASALALMLRSVGIPSRIVVGYRTEEFNAVGKYYIARQSHAHSWVEALIDRNQMPAGVRLSGQPRASKYWMRLDPTPAASAEDDGNREGVEGLMNLATNIWQDYVVELDSERQQGDLVKAAGLQEIQDSYVGLFGKVRQKLGALNERSLSVERGQWRGRLPVIPILSAAVLVVLMWGFLKIVSSGRLRRNTQRVGRNPNSIPLIDFYAETLKVLSAIGIRRQMHETPSEFAHRNRSEFPMLGLITSEYLHCRFSESQNPVSGEVDAALAELKRMVDERKSGGSSGN